MNNWVEDIRDMHAWFFGSLRERVKEMPPHVRREFWRFRVRFLQEELRELAEARTPGDAVDALVDLCVVAIGTLDAFGVHADAAWLKVKLANMQKRPGVKPERPNPFGLPDLVKPEGWTAPDHSSNVGFLGEVIPC